MSIKPFVLLILDGFGLSLERTGNAIALAKKPNFEKISSLFPGAALHASGYSVGIPWGEMGNSEVGHITLGAGEIVYQRLSQINLAIERGDFQRMPVWKEAVDRADKYKSAIHLMGVFSNAGVHGHIDHLLLLLDILADLKTTAPVYFHLFTDGRDSPPYSSPVFLRMLTDKIQKRKIGKIATIMGRHYAMDRNRLWSLTEKAYSAMTLGEGDKYKSAEEVIADFHRHGFTDEYIRPSVIIDEKGQPVGLIKKNDVVIFYNYRPDRPRQLTEAFVNAEFSGFKRERVPNLFFVTMARYDPRFTVKVVFPSPEIEWPLARILAENGKRQLHIAETEKYAQVTYFFNGGREEPFENEDRILVTSPAVSAYDQKPEMSANEITDIALKKIEENQYDFILINFANGDMVGHTGNLQAAIKAVETLDKSIGRLYRKILEKDGVMIITADHGNVEELINLKTMNVDTEHSTNPVPFWLIANRFENKTPVAKLTEIIASGSLIDVTPTILELMNIEKPKKYLGTSLVGKISKLPI